MTRTWLPALLFLAVAGCAGTRPEPPAAAAVVPPAGWRGDAGTGIAIEAGWWRGFGDPVLTAIVETALANNVDIGAAAARVAEARGQFSLAQAQRLPNFFGTANGGRERSVSAFGEHEWQTAGQGQLQITYDLDLFGRLASASKAAKAALLSTEAAQDGVRLAITSAAASGYLGLRALDARLLILRDTLAARADSLKLARRRFEAGYASRLDLSQAESEYHATEQLIPAAQLAITRQEDALSLLLGDHPRAIERGVKLMNLASPPLPSALPSALLRRRPDIAQAEQQLVAADHSLDSARAAFLPNIQLGLSQGEVISTLLANPFGIFSLGGSVLAPLLDAGRLEAQQDIVAARRDQAAFAYRRNALTAFREVEDAYAAIRRTDEQEQSLSRQREALARLLDTATKRYKAGYSPYLEQLDAQRSLLSAELALVQTRVDRLTANVSLYQALGGGWIAPVTIADEH